MDNQTFLTREQFLETNDIPFRDVELPAPYKGMVRVTGLSGEEASAFSTNSDVIVDKDGSVKASDVPPDMMAKLLSKTITNDQFEQLFTPADVAAINKKSAKTILFLAEIALELSGLGNKSKEDAQKN